MAIALKIIVGAIGRQNHVVVVAEHDEGAWRDAADLKVVAVLTLQLLL